MEKPVLYVLTGKVYAGKTTLGRSIARITGASLLSQDQINSDCRLTEKDYVREPGLGSAVEQEQAQRVRRVLASGRSVIDDGVYPTRTFRSARLSVANGFDVRRVLIHVETPDDEIWRRRSENGASNGRLLLPESRVREVLSTYEPPVNEKHIVFRSGIDSVPEWLEKNAVLLN